MVLLSRYAPPAAAPTLSPGRRPKLLFLVTEDWYFCSHRLPVARAARAAGFDIVVATRVGACGEAIRDEGFALHPLAWRRRGDGALGAGRAVAAIARLYRAERPDIVHHVALKPVLFGGFAARLAFPQQAKGPARLAAVMGLGSGFAASPAGSRWPRRPLWWALRLAIGGGRVIVQNPEDRAARIAGGIAPARIALIRGSGVDVGHFAPLPEPAAPGITVAFVGRMLRSKGALAAVAAVTRLRAEGMAIDLVLAGPTDPENPDSLTADELSAAAATLGVEWLGRVADVRAVWRRAALAVFPSTYGEGLPKALLEAAACARAIVATDMPGCREVVRHGETGLLVPPHDIAALAAAVALLAADPARRQAMGRAGRTLVERDFAETVIARQTLALYRDALAERRGVAARLGIAEGMGRQ